MPTIEPVVRSPLDRRLARQRVEVVGVDVVDQQRGARAREAAEAAGAELAVEAALLGEVVAARFVARRLNVHRVARAAAHAPVDRVVWIAAPVQRRVADQPAQERGRARHACRQATHAARVAAAGVHVDRKADLVARSAGAVAGVRAAERVGDRERDAARHRVRVHALNLVNKVHVDRHRAAAERRAGRVGTRQLARALRRHWAHGARRRRGGAALHRARANVLAAARTGARRKRLHRALARFHAVARRAERTRARALAGARRRVLRRRIRRSWIRRSWIRWRRIRRRRAAAVGRAALDRHRLVAAAVVDAALAPRVVAIAGHVARRRAHALATRHCARHTALRTRRRRRIGGRRRWRRRVEEARRHRILRRRRRRRNRRLIRRRRRRNRRLVRRTASSDLHVWKREGRRNG